MLSVVGRDEDRVADVLQSPPDKTGHDRGNHEPEAPVDQAHYRGGPRPSKAARVFLIPRFLRPTNLESAIRGGLRHRVDGEEDGRHLQRESQYVPQAIAPATDQVRSVLGWRRWRLQRPVYNIDPGTAKEQATGGFF